MVTSVLCALLLWRAYMRTRTPLLLWCAISFGLLALNNTMFVIDVLWVPAASLVTLRQLTAFGAAAVLIYGFIWEVG
jgi:hypothetical protein